MTGPGRAACSLGSQTQTVTPAGHSRDHPPRPSTLRTTATPCTTSSIRAICVRAATDEQTLVRSEAVLRVGLDNRQLAGRGCDGHRSVARSCVGCVPATVDRCNLRRGSCPRHVRLRGASNWRSSGRSRASDRAAVVAQICRDALPNHPDVVAQISARDRRYETRSHAGLSRSIGRRRPAPARIESCSTSRGAHR